MAAPGGKPRYQRVYAHPGVTTEAQPAPYSYAAQRPVAYDLAQRVSPGYGFPIIAEEDDEDEEQEQTPQRNAAPERREGPAGDSRTKPDRRPPAKAQTAGSAPDRVRHEAAKGKPQQDTRPRPKQQAQVKPQAAPQMKPQPQTKPKPQVKPHAQVQAQVKRPYPAAPRPAPMTQVRAKPLPAAAKPKPRPVKPAAPAARTPSNIAPAKSAPVKAPGRPRYVKAQPKKEKPFAKPAPVAKNSPPPKKAAPPQPLPARSAGRPVKPVKPAPAAPGQSGSGRGLDGRKALDLAGAVVAAITRGSHKEVYRRMGRTYREAVSEDVLGAMIEQMNAAYGGARAQTPAGSEVASGARPGGAGNAGLTFRYSVRTGSGPRPFFVQIVREGDTLVCADFFYG